MVIVSALLLDEPAPVQIANCRKHKTWVPIGICGPFKPSVWLEWDGSRLAGCQPAAQSNLASNQHKTQRLARENSGRTIPLT